MPVATKQDATDLRAPVAEGPQEQTSVPDHSNEWGLPLGGAAAAPAPAAVVPTPVPASISQLPMGAAQLSPVGHLGSRTEIQDELDRMAFAIRAFSLKQPDAVLREVAMYSARLTELAVLLHRVENLDRQYTRVRTQQVERWQKELELQFKIASRLIEVPR